MRALCPGAQGGHRKGRDTRRQVGRNRPKQ